MDRSSAGSATLQTLVGASAIDEVSHNPTGAVLKLHILVDSSSVEVFANDGEVAMTACFFPEPEATGVELYALDGTVRLNRLAFYPLSSATPATD